MKKIMSVLVSAVMLCAFMLPAAAANTAVNYSENLYLGFETEDEAALGTAVSNAKKELVSGGVFGSAGALKVTVSDNSGFGAFKYDLSTVVGKNYNVSVYLKPEEITFGTVKAIFYHDALKNGETADGYEELVMKAGETTEDGYIRYYIDNYKMNPNARVWASAADGGSANYPKTDDLATTLEIRVGAQGTYIMDELKCEPVDNKILQADSFELASGLSANYARTPSNSDPWTSDVFAAKMLPHDQAKHTQLDGNGCLYIVGSGEQGAFFSDVTLMPATTYRLSAKVRMNNLSRSVRAFMHNPTNTAITSDENYFSFTSGKMYGPETKYEQDGQWHEFEYYFRTKRSKNVPEETYSKDGFVIDRIGIACTSGGYESWYIDDMCLEEVNELPYNGSFNHNGFTGDAKNGTIAVPAFEAGDKFTTLTAVPDDGTNADRGDYLKVSLVGGKSSDPDPDNAEKTMGTTRRLRAVVNLKQQQKYRLSFWMRLTENSTLKTATVSAMHNIGKVEYEEGGTPAYGRITVPNGSVTTEWKKYTAEFNVQNAQKVGDLYLSVNGDAPEQDTELAIDEIKLEPIGAEYYDASVTKVGNTLTATETTGANVGKVLEKYYNFYVSSDGVHYAKAGTNKTGSFELRGSDFGKFMKSEVIGTKADGTVLKTQSSPIEIKITGYQLSFTSSLTDETVTATATYYPENDETMQFDAIIALYGSDNSLLGVEHVASGNNTASLSIANVSGAVKAKIFAWNTLESAIPLVKSVELLAN